MCGLKYTPESFELPEADIEIVTDCSRCQVKAGIDILPRIYHLRCDSAVSDRTQDKVRKYTFCSDVAKQ